MPTFGSLFAGIGGIDLGLERAGWDCRFQVEWDPYCQHVLAHHWPDVPRHGDIHDVHGAGHCVVADADSDGRDRLSGQGAQGDEGTSRDGVEGRRCSGCLPQVDLLAGGFPCQPFSNAGKRRGVEDERWLWPEFARLIGELRPRYVLVENVPGLLARHGGMGRVLGDLATLGYDAEWDSIPAAAVGAPHLRYRVWIVAYANGAGLGAERVESATNGHASHGHDADGSDSDVAHPDSLGCGRQAEVGPPGLTGLRPEEAGAEPHGAGDGAVADAERGGQPGPGQPVDACDREACCQGQATDAVHGGIGDERGSQSHLGGMVDGLSSALDGGDI
jgi:DNA-cytosine methyltransferase